VNTLPVDDIVKEVADKNSIGYGKKVREEI